VASLAASSAGKAAVEPLQPKSPPVKAPPVTTPLQTRSPPVKAPPLAKHGPPCTKQIPLPKWIVPALDARAPVFTGA